MKVKDIGEQGLLKKLKSFCPHDIIGDDAAVLSINPQQKLVVTTDVLVDGIHFSQTTTPPESVGWRAIAANLSDLAAMGASPLGVTVGLAVPGHLSVDWVEHLYQGMSHLLAEYNTPIVGGDICRSEVTSVSITALGEVYPNRIIKRSTAQPGDVIVTTGYHGMSRGGLELLLNPSLANNLGQDIRDRLIKAHQYPKPRLDLLPHLWEIMETHTITGMDSSDGLGDAIMQICAMSEVGAQIQLSQLPCVSMLSQWFSSAQALNWVLYGGEDFELVLCLAEEMGQKLVKTIGQEGKIIGKIIEKKSVILIDGNQEEALSLDKSFQHFS
ncbi:thiamine monophosphate kinase [Crocosphaera subtropica ATCC 51142]|uniref:Thiamine-monophosphate kinase n=1 Tax=Crocosphaera subtropica (strain ATCC 51142 / BH68) TaxID=43989 RepID=B1WZA9_CROS5|nr:thiamine-phosphate kinase [Crocosphaera subtropica]ACB49475.1 thiamine monophosphate kinase [Crocosphaera subtropica ATCC 51142]